jgi:hypothetical protein
MPLDDPAVVVGDDVLVDVVPVVPVVVVPAEPTVALVRMYDAFVVLPVVVAVEVLVVDEGLLPACRQPVTVTESAEAFVRDGVLLCVVVGGGVCAAAAMNDAARNAAVTVAMPI